MLTPYRNSRSQGGRHARQDRDGGHPITQLGGELPSMGDGGSHPIGGSPGEAPSIGFDPVGCHRVGDTLLRDRG